MNKLLKLKFYISSLFFFFFLIIKFLLIDHQLFKKIFKDNFYIIEFILILKNFSKNEKYDLYLFSTTFLTILIIIKYIFGKKIVKSRTILKIY